MPRPSPHSMTDLPQQTVLNEFLKALIEDRDAGSIQDLDHYLGRFPGHAEVLAREYLEFTDAEREPGPEDERIGDYELVRELGRGGQGIVYLARDTALNRDVALKVLRAGSDLSAGALARFRREAEITAGLDHPGICTVFDAGTHQGFAFIAMRYVDGEPLSVRCRAETPPDAAGIDDALRVVQEAARALHAAHDAGVIHRDVKPANILITADGRPVLTDFGLASIEGEGLTLTRTGDLLGTPAYMSPEQIALERNRVDRRTDVYSLGVTLFECLTACRPFEAPTREGTYHAILTEPTPAPARRNPLVPRDVEVILETAMEKDPERRYQTAAAFADDLGRALRREPIAARPIGRIVRVSRWAQRNPALAAATVVTIIAITVIGIGVTTQNRQLRDLNEKALNSASVASSQRERAEDALARLSRLSDDLRLRNLRSRQDELWPSAPAQLTPLKTWLEDAEGLVAQRDFHAASLAALEKQRGEDADADLLWRLEISTRLVEGLDEIAKPESGLIARVRERARRASTIHERSITTHADDWARVRRELRNDARFAGLDLRPQLGLVPLGRDPDSGLQEFLHLEMHAGPIPSRESSPRISIDEDFGLVFVLVPGGTFAMGASTEGPNADPVAFEIEWPVHSVTLDPFFIAKYEVNQAQYARFTGRRPSWFRPEKEFNHITVSHLHPVTNISWHDATRFAFQLGLSLATEAQWEYACRAGSVTPYFFGDRSLDDFANLADVSFSDVFGQDPFSTEFEDGFGVTAPVGSFRPNDFGLYDMVGNVFEWCRDGIVSYEKAVPSGPDGLRPSPSSSRVLRGGSYKTLPRRARSSARAFQAPKVSTSELGIRLVRPIEEE